MAEKVVSGQGTCELRLKRFFLGVKRVSRELPYREWWPWMWNLCNYRFRSSLGFEVLRGWHLFTAVCLEAPEASHKDDEFDGISTARCGCVTGLFYRDVTGVGYLDTDRSDDRPHRWRWWHPHAVTTSLAGMLVWFLEKGVYSRYLRPPGDSILFISSNRKYPHCK